MADYTGQIESSYCCCCDSSTDKYYNVNVCQSFQKNDCTAPQIGTTEEICVEASGFKEKEAKKKAEAWLALHGQNAANELGICINEGDTVYQAKACKSFQKNDCTPNTTGSWNQICVTSSSTVDEADAYNKAEEWLDKNGQSIVNELGVCHTNECEEQTKYYNTAYCESERKDDCTDGFMGTLVELCAVAGQFESTKSQEDAQDQAKNWVIANKQKNANDNGECIPIKNCPGNFEIGGQTLYQSTRIALGSTAGKVRFLLGTYEQADSFDIYYGDVDDNKLIWSTKSLPTADPITGMVSTALIRANNYNNGLYKQYAICANEIEVGNNQESMYEIAIEFDYNPTNLQIQFVTLVTQAPEIGTRWSYKMGCPCTSTDFPQGTTWNYCQSCADIGTVFKNTRQTKTFTKQCTDSDQYGTEVIVVIEANDSRFDSNISVEDANQKAKDWLTANGQAQANIDGLCLDKQKYYNIEYCDSATRNNCEEGYIGSTVQYCVPTGRYSSTVSQDAANALAQADLVANVQTNANVNGTCTSNISFRSARYCEYFTPVCPDDQQAVDINYCAYEGQFTGTTQAEANQKAIDWVKAGGQTFANTNGICTSTVLYNNIKQCQTFTRNNCPPNNTPGTYQYCIEAGKYTGTTQAEADQKAVNDITANGQNITNINAICTPIDVTPNWQNTGNNSCSESNTEYKVCSSIFTPFTVNEDNFMMVIMNENITSHIGLYNNNNTVNLSTNFIHEFCFFVNLLTGAQKSCCVILERTDNLLFLKSGGEIYWNAVLNSTDFSTYIIEENKTFYQGIIDIISDSFPGESYTIPAQIFYIPIGEQYFIGSSVKGVCPYYWVERKDMNINSPSYGNKEYQRDSTNDGTCNTDNPSTDANWQNIEYVCSCSADSVLGSNEGPYCFEKQKDTNPLSPTYNNERTIRRSSLDTTQCPKTEIWIVGTETNDYVCVGFDKHAKEYKVVCGVRTGDTRAGQLIESNSTDCGGKCDPIWVATGITRCVTDTNGDNTGKVEEEQRDNALCSNTYNTTKWVISGEDFTKCPVKVGNDRTCLSFTRNNCNAKYCTGTSIQTCVEANTYFADTKTAANALATTYINSVGQANANSQGTCNCSTTADWSCDSGGCSGCTYAVTCTDINPNSSTYNSTKPQNSVTNAETCGTYSNSGTTCVSCVQYNVLKNSCSGTTKQGTATGNDSACQTSVSWGSTGVTKCASSESGSNGSGEYCYYQQRENSSCRSTSGTYRWIASGSCCAVKGSCTYGGKTFTGIDQIYINTGGVYPITLNLSVSLVPGASSTSSCPFSTVTSLSGSAITGCTVSGSNTSYTINVTAASASFTIYRESSGCGSRSLGVLIGSY